MHAEGLLCTMHLPSLVLIAEAFFLLECGHKYTQMSLITVAMQWLLPASVGNEN